MIYTLNATTVTPGGNVFFLFPKADGGTSTPTLPSGWTFFWASRYGEGLDWDKQWAWGIQVPSNASPGNYTIATPSDGDQTITVVAAPAPRPVQYVTPFRFSSVQTLLNQGFDIHLVGAVFDNTASISVPDGATIYGSNAVIRQHPNGESVNRTFVPAGSFTLDGVTLDRVNAVGTDRYVHASSSPTGNLTFRNCTIKTSHLISAYPTGLTSIISCEFKNSGCTGQLADRIYISDCDFRGHTYYGQHACFLTGGTAGLITSSRWHCTNRGIVIQTGDVVGFLFTDLQMTSIRGGEGNANECLLFEAGTGSNITPDSTHGMRNNAVIDFWITDCAGPAVSLYGTGMHGNVFFNGRMHTDNTGISIAALNGGTIGANSFSNMECTGGLALQGDVGSQTFDSMHFKHQEQRVGNSDPNGIQETAATAAYPINADTTAKSKSYTFTNCKYWKDNASQSVTSTSFTPA